MKQLLHLKSLLIALLVLFGGGGISASEQTETITFSEKGYKNGESVTTVTGTGITIKFYKGTNSNNVPTYYDTGTAVRVYGGNYFTVTANSNKITNIVIVFGSGDGSNSITTNSGTYSSGTWTGNAESVTFTIGGTKGNRRIASIAVTYVSEQGQGTLDPQNSFANATENATVGVPCTVQEITTLSTGRKSYASSDETVATIDGSGNVTLKKAGETTITVTTAADDNYKEGSASYKLIVAKGTPVLSFAQETVTAYLGTDQNGPELNNPSKIAVTYEISNPDIATIQSNGYIQPKATGTAIVTVTPADTDAWNSVQVSYTLIVEEPFHVDAEGDYEWVKDASTLAVGDELVIVYQSSNTVATVMGNQDTNNFKYVAVNYADGITDKSVITIPQAKAAQATPILLEGSEGAWYFHTNNGYLCAVSSDNNYLKTTTTIDDYAKATISITDTEATIKFLGKNTRNIIRYNSQSSLFSCYSSGQNPVQLYRKVPSNVAPTITFSPASGTVVDYGTQVTITARTATSITYSVNNGEPVTINGNSATVTINTHTTIKATATNDYGTSEEVTAEYTINQESSALSYNPTEYTISIGDDFTAPEVNKPADYNGTITYSSDNTDVAEVDATTGEVTIKAVGVANITASGTETEHYAAATASYKITVNKKTSAVSFTEALVEITYGDNYNKQAATTEGISGNLVYTSSNETVVKFHGNNVIDVLKPGTVTITATAPATETTEESSATYTLKIYEPADAVEGQTELLNEKFDDCKGDEPKDGFDGNISGFTTAPTSLTEAGWELSYCQAGAGFLKLTSGDGNGIVVTPTLDLNGQSEFSFEIAPWVNETATVTVSLENATFEDGIETSKSFNDLEQNTWKTKSFGIVGNGNVRIKIEATSRVFIDNFIVGGGAQPAHEINLTFSSAGYLTWVATADIDFDQTADVTAYQITEATPQGITAEEVKKAPKGAALLLKGTGTVELKRTSGVASLNGNKMLACTDASVTGITGSATSTDIYVLGNGGNGLGFYMLKNTLQAGKGYLSISGGASAKATFIGFEETEAAETTGISDYTVPSTEDDNFYNLQGVRVVRPQKGIYIKNGKKMIIK